MWKNLTGLHKNQTWTLIKFVEINWNGNFDWATSPKIWPVCVWMGSNPFMYSTSSRKLGMTLCNHKAHTMLKKLLTADVFFVLNPADLWHILFTDTAVMTRWIILMESEKWKEEVSACETHFTAQSTHKTKQLHTSARDRETGRVNGRVGGGLDGWKGLTETAPFTKILVVAIPETQLKMTLT